MLSLRIDKKKRLLVIVSGVLVVLVGISRFGPFFDGLGGLSDEIALKEQQLLKYLRAVKQGEGIAEGFRVLKRERNQLESQLLTGDTPSLAAVEIQKNLIEIVKKSGVELNTIRVLKPEVMEDARYTRIPVQFTMTSTMRQLKQVLYRIEGSKMYLRLQKVRIDSYSRRSSRELRSDITLVGFMKSPAAE
jgi:hypothetical protein